LPIVLVNDDPTQLTLLAGLLRKQGWETRAFAAAEAALGWMDPDRPPDLIVTDLYMPGIDGWRFCRLLRSPEFPGFNSVPILVVSATFSGDAADRIAADIGADAFLPSPVEGARFVATVRSLLAGTAETASPRALIIEDSRSLAEALEAAFRAHGYRADASLEGRQGISAFRGEAIDVAVIDYHLPDGPGDSLLRAFRAWNPNCVCVMMTSDPRPELAVAWMKAGAAAYVRKPFQAEYLIEVCDRARRERAMLRAEEVLERRTRQLRASESLNKTVVDALREGVHIVGPDLRLLLVNRRFREWCGELGLSPDAVGRPLAEAFPFLPSSALDEYRWVFENDAPLFGQEEFEIGGRRVFIESRKIPVRGPNGVQSVLTVVSDVTRRREAEERLRRKNEEQSLLLDAIPTQVWYLTDEETYGRINQAHADFIGLPKDRIECRRLTDFLRPEEAAVCREGNRRVFAERTPIHTEEWVWNGRGDRRLLQIAKSPWRNADGEVESVVCAGDDITGLRAAQEALQKERDFAESLVETAPIIILVLDAEGRIIRFNSFMERLAGRPLDAVKGADWFSTFLRPEDQGEVRRRFEDALEERKPPGAANDIVAADGREITVEWFHTPLRDAEGAITGLLAVGHDVTEKRRFELQLHEEKERLEQVIEGTRAGIWEWWIPTGDARFSERWAEIAGYTLGELAPVSIQTWIGLCHPDDLAQSDARLREHFAGELSFYECVCRMRHKSGRWVWVRDRGEVVERDADGRPLRMIGTHIDITREKEMERERRRVEQQTHQLRKAESLERMAGAVAHHFNNLLFSVQGNLEMALEDGGGLPEVTGYLEAAMASARRGARLGERMLAYLGYRWEPLSVLDVAEICRDFLAMVRAGLPAGVTLVAELPDAGPPVRGRPEAVRRILENLVENAAEALEDRGGEIRVRLGGAAGTALKSEELTPVGFQPDGDGRYAVLEVADDGPGISPDDREHIFDPFFSTRFVGRGLGLAVVHGAVKALGGAVAVDGAPGKGSRFRVFLPAESPGAGG
jgi:PAS domain S-box-containing protein